MENTLKNMALYFMVSLLIILFSLRHEYITVGSQNWVFRINRLTGAAQVLSTQGWVDFQNWKAQ